MRAKLKLICWCVLPLFAVIYNPTSGNAVTIIAENVAPVQNVPSITTHMTRGDTMLDMVVEVLFSSGLTESAPWVLTGGFEEGAAQGIDGDWSLTQAGDTYFGPWTLHYMDTKGKGILAGFRIDGFTAGVADPTLSVMFDRTFGLVEGTMGSALGKDFVSIPNPFPSFDILVTYSGSVGVGGGAPVGDLFRNLDVRFRDPSGQSGGLNGDNITTLTFQQDTDNPAIPEPSTFILLGLGCLGLASAAAGRGRRTHCCRLDRP